MLQEGTALRCCRCCCCCWLEEDSDIKDLGLIRPFEAFCSSLGALKGSLRGLYKPLKDPRLEGPYEALKGPYKGFYRPAGAGRRPAGFDQIVGARKRRLGKRRKRRLLRPLQSLIRPLNDPVNIRPLRKPYKAIKGA